MAVRNEWGKEIYLDDLAGMRKGKTQFGITKRRKWHLTGIM